MSFGFFKDMLLNSNETVFGEIEKFLSEELIELWLLNSRTAEVEQGIRNGNLRRFTREMSFRFLKDMLLYSHEMVFGEIEKFLSQGLIELFAEFQNCGSRTRYT